MQVPALVVDGTGRPLWVNHAAQAADGASAKPGALPLLAALAPRVARLVERQRAAETPHADEVVALSDWRLRLLLSRIGSGAEYFGLVLLLPAPEGAESGPKPGLETLLSPTERRLVQLICQGSSLRAAADEMRISYHTARKYLQTVFQKTGARRQAELVAAMLMPRSRA